LSIVVVATFRADAATARIEIEIEIEIEIDIEIVYNMCRQLDRLLSLGPLHFAIQDLLASWARVSSTRYTYRHT
jgi:hypothetical protein